EGALELNISGTPKTPQFQGWWRYTIPALAAQLPLVWQGDARATGDNLLINSQLKEADNNLAELTARYPLDLINTPEKLNAQIELKANLSASRLFLNPRRYPTSGLLNLNLNLAGSLSAPSLSGALTVENGAFSDKLLGSELKNINFNVALQNNQLSLLHGEAQDGDENASRGTLAVTGGCPHTYPVANCQFSLALKQLQLVKNRQLNARATGEIKADITDKQLKLTGALNLSPATLMLSNSYGSSIKELTVEEITQQPKPFSGLFWPSPQVDIQWQLGGYSQVRGRGLEAQMAGTLRTQGPLNQLVYDGTFYTTKGTMDLFNKRFILDAGDVRFGHGQIYLNIPAHYQSQVNGQAQENSTEAFTIQAKLQGDLNHLNLELHSTPTLPPDEVLARLIFGKQIQTITPFEGVQLAAALQQLRAGNGFDLMNSARSLLGVDRLNIDSQKNTDGSTGVNVGVGKYISEKVYVEIQRTPNPNTPWQGQIEVELTPSVNFESNTGEHGQGGAKLLWRRDY
ncbi:MAG: hypothetical protein RL497_2158, partial [Pseudomonadota bacterium]